MSANPQPLLTVEDVAARLRVRQARTVRGYIQSGRLRAMRLPCGEYRVCPNDLARFEASLFVEAGTSEQVEPGPIQRRRRGHQPRVLGQNKIALA